MEAGAVAPPSHVPTFPPSHVPAGVLDGAPEADDYHSADEVPAPEFSAAAPAAASEASEPMSRPRLRDASPEQRARARQDALVRQALDLFDGSLVDVKTVATPGTVIAPGGPAE